jgi:hypothetical protein
MWRMGAKCALMLGHAALSATCFFVVLTTLPSPFADGFTLVGYMPNGDPLYNAPNGMGPLTLDNELVEGAFVEFRRGAEGTPSFTSSPPCLLFPSALSVQRPRSAWSRSLTRTSPSGPRRMATISPLMMTLYACLELTLLTTKQRSQTTMRCSLRNRRRKHSSCHSRCARVATTGG